MNVLPIRVTHIFLDVDGTLVDFPAALQTGIEAAATYLSGRVGSSIPAQALHDARRRLPTASRLGMAEIWRRAFHQVLRERGINDGDAALEALQLYREARDAALRVYDDVAEPLTLLRERGFILIAATNGNAALEHTPIHGLLHGRWTAEDATAPKPHPDFYLQALERTGAVPAASLMIGDRMENDIEPAHSVGMHGILLDRYGDHDEPPPPARAVIHTFADLPALVEHAGVQ